MNSTGQLYATVAIDQPVDATYTYVVPTELRGAVVVGSRVTVPLGRGNRLEQATVLAVSAEEPEKHETRNMKHETETGRRGFLVLCFVFRVSCFPTLK